jgi:translation initiation factor 3 subunit L
MGDYHASLAALAPVYSTGEIADEVNAVFPAKLSLAYHAGVSYLMLRRYKDAIRVFGDMCVQMNRGFTVSLLAVLEKTQFTTNILYFLPRMF